MADSLESQHLIIELEA